MAQNLIFKVNGITYEIDKIWIDSYKQLGIEINDAFVKELVPYECVYSDGKEHSLTFAIAQNYYNLFYFSSKFLGQIYEYNNKGEIINKYSKPQDIIGKGSLTNLYGFEKLEKKDIRPKILKYNFFGCYLTVFTPNIYLDEFNKLIKKAASLESSIALKRAYAREKRKYKVTITFKEYVNNRLKKLMFTGGESIHITRESKKYIDERQNIDLDLYNSVMSKLTERYAIDGIELILKIDNLDDADFPGLYILCLDKYKGIYVGQATKSIKKRLIEHYRKPSSSFDCTYMPYHVTKVYVLRCLATDILDYLERDLIACVGKEITLNSSIGGHDLLLFTNDKEYNPENFKLTDNQLKKLPL